MGEQMEFPENFERFAKEYGFKDDKEVYTNGLDLIPIFRVKQWLEHDDKLRRIEMDTAYECGKHANQRMGQWIITHRNGVNTYVCSECNNEPLLIGESYPIFKLSDYCPYCGTKMEVK